MDLDFGDGFDVCVSALAIHHQSHQKKCELFESVFNALNPGGYFCIIDWIKFEDEQQTFAALQSAEAHVRNAVPKDIADAWVHHWKFLNCPSTEQEICRGLLDAGFHFSFCPVKHFGMSLIYAVK